MQDDQAQALYVVEQILAAREQGTLLRRQAVLMRSSHHSDVLELELIRRNIPYVKYGGLKFLEAAHVKDVLALLRWADNPRNRIAGFRVLQLLPGVGPATADRCLEGVRSERLRLADARRSIACRRPRQTDWSRLIELLSRSRRSAREWAGQLGAPAQVVRAASRAHLRCGRACARATSSSSNACRRSIAIARAIHHRADARSAAGDAATSPATPLLDEDYLILSTVHSAKGQEWDSVYVLNVTDGNFPNEHATGKPELIEEERRLLYVAMTRAKHDLHLIAPLKYYVTQQSRTGDTHVYGARSRFMTDRLLAQFEQKAWPATREAAIRASDTKANVRVDAAAALRAMWE